MDWPARKGRSRSIHAVARSPVTLLRERGCFESNEQIPRHNRRALHGSADLRSRQMQIDQFHAADGHVLPNRRDRQKLPHVTSSRQAAPATTEPAENGRCSPSPGRTRRHEPSRPCAMRPVAESVPATAGCPARLRLRCIVDSSVLQQNGKRHIDAQLSSMQTVDESQAIHVARPSHSTSLRSHDS